jgi:hypothetical protein
MEDSSWASQNLKQIVALYKKKKVLKKIWCQLHEDGEKITPKHVAAM